MLWVQYVFNYYQKIEEVWPFCIIFDLENLEL